MADDPENHSAQKKWEAERRVVFVVGATATGKSSWALQMAKRHQGVIFNCDSIQIYKGLDVGSAKPSRQDYNEVPHFLFDLAAPPQTLTTGDYRRAFDLALEKIPAEQVVFLVGGSGFYFQAVEKGLFPVGKASPELREELESELKLPQGAEKLFKELQEKDPESALKISINDHYRLVRALEIIRAENTTLTEIKRSFSEQATKPDYRILKIGLGCSREELWKRIHIRAEEMVKSGLRQEVQGLLDQGLGEWAPLSSVGYMQARASIREAHSDAWLIESITVATRQLSKKQKTWFKRDKEIFWIEDEASRLRAEEALAQFLR